MLYSVKISEFYINEDDSKNTYLQMDKIMKKLFTLKEKTPIIDFLNSAYGDNLSYESVISYSNTEINNSKAFSASYITFHADMFITVADSNKVYEYAIEFQTRFDEEILIRMFRYSFERAAKLEYLRNKNKVRLKFPEPYLILLEEEKEINDEITLEIEMPKAVIINFKVKVLKYWDYDLQRLYDENMYLLYPLQIFKLRKDMEIIKNSKKSEQFKKVELKLLSVRLLETIKKTLVAIDKAYEDGKIELTNYDEMTTVIENLNSYLLDRYNLDLNIEKEVEHMVKSFYDPNVERRGLEKGLEKGIEKGIKFVAENMIKDGDSNDKIKRNTSLEEEQIDEIRKLIRSNGEH